MTTEAQERLAARLEALLLGARQAWDDGQQDKAFGILEGAVLDTIQDLRGLIADEEKRAAAPYPVAPGHACYACGLSERAGVHDPQHGHAFDPVGR